MTTNSKTYIRNILTNFILRELTDIVVEYIGAICVIIHKTKSLHLPMYTLQYCRKPIVNVCIDNIGTAYNYYEDGDNYRYSSFDGITEYRNTENHTIGVYDGNIITAKWVESKLLVYFSDGREYTINPEHKKEGLETIMIRLDNLYIQIEYKDKAGMPDGVELYLFDKTYNPPIFHPVDNIVDNQYVTVNNIPYKVRIQEITYKRKDNQGNDNGYIRIQLYNASSSPQSMVAEKNYYIGAMEVEKTGKHITIIDEVNQLYSMVPIREFVIDVLEHGSRPKADADKV